MVKLNKIVLLIVSILLAFNAYADSFEGKSNEIFNEYFKSKKIKGTGHVFWIVLDCEKNHLMEMSNKLPKGKIKVVEYDFSFNVNTRDKAKTKITGGNLTNISRSCIINKYHNDIFFSPMAAEIMSVDIAFPATLQFGKEPLAPKTAIGFIISEE